MSRQSESATTANSTDAPRCTTDAIGMQPVKGSALGLASTRGDSRNWDCASASWQSFGGPTPADAGLPASRIHQAAVVDSCSSSSHLTGGVRCCTSNLNSAPFSLNRQIVIISGDYP
jgi:hypothetical protein